MTVAVNALGALALVAAVFALWKFLSWRSRHLDNMMEGRDVFFRAAHTLLVDDETPPLIVDQLEFMAKFINDPWIGRVLFIAALRGDLRRAIKNPPQHALDVKRAVERMRPELRKQYGIAAASMIFAATFTNVVIGTFLRRILLFWLSSNDDEPKSAEIIVTDVASIKYAARELVA